MSKGWDEQNWALIAAVLIILIPLLILIALSKPAYWLFTLFMRIARPTQKAERYLINLSFWIPRDYREAIIGDILEDCHELRALGKSERRVRTHVLWQLLIAIIIMLRPTNIVRSLSRKANLKD